jgi:hypothetical protein
VGRKAMLLLQRLSHTSTSCAHRVGIGESFVVGQKIDTLSFTRLRQPVNSLRK